MPDKHEDKDTGEESPDLEREIARLLIGGRAIRHRRMRRALATQLGDSDD